MTKQQRLIRAIREVSPTMNEEQIENAIRTLEDCRQDLFELEADRKRRAYMEKNLPKGDTRLEKYLEDMRLNENVFCFQRMQKSVSIRTLGVSLLLREDYLKYRDWLPPVERDWWLADRALVRKDGSCRNDLWDAPLAGIRPVLLIDSIQGDLRPGDLFTIEEDGFMLLDHRLAIRSELFPGLNCGYPCYVFRATPLFQTLNLWYSRLHWANVIK